MNKIKCILLVDDDKTTNFLNEELIYDLEIAEQVQVAYNGLEALNYINREGKFKPAKRGDFPKPNIIFLDINMPLMDGYEFLAEYDNLPKAKKAEVVIIFLTTSDSHKDKLNLGSDKLVTEYLEKPLRKEELLKIRDLYFKNIQA